MQYTGVVVSMKNCKSGFRKIFPVFRGKINIGDPLLGGAGEEKKNSYI